MSTYRPSWGLDELDSADPAGDKLNPVDEDAAEDGWCYGSVEQWVHEWALPTLGTAAQTGGRRWCAQWHQRPEGNQQ